MRCWILCLMLVAMPGPAAAREIAADLSSPYVDVTTGFTGANLLVFGSVEQPGDLAIVVTGPSAQAVVRQKSRMMGIWINADSAIFDQVPGYYAIATSKPMIATKEAGSANGLSLEQLRFPLHKGNTAKAEIFRQALLQNKKALGLYAESPEGIRISPDRLFRATFFLPANVPTGSYTVRIYLLRDGHILATQTLPLTVRKTGLSATIYKTAHDRPYTYGFGALLMALIMGSGTAFLFQRMA